MSRRDPMRDPEIAAAAERLAEAVDRDFRRKVAGALRQKRMPAARLAEMFAGIAADLREDPSRFTLATPGTGPDDD